MAKASVICTSILLLSLFLSYGILSTEGRPLMMTEKNTNDSKFMTNDEETTRAMRVISSSAQSDRPIVDELETESEGDDFRPTTPGHSPGVGHGNGPATVEHGV
ncbi:precursor of CEP9-like [Forsythia ovata]|uniref:Precursor of CEP9-like n=1 Tax=Forsythia ovata TaxID=205694 RepID=A0ABD1VMM9_9LAMI